MSNTNIFNWNIILGISFLIVGLFFFIRDGRKMVENHLDKDYILASNSIKKFGASIFFLIAGLFLINQELNLL